MLRNLDPCGRGGLHRGDRLLNEVLSLNAQEFREELHDVRRRALSSMKS